MTGLKDHQDTPGNTDHQAGYCNIFKAVGHFLCNGIRSPAHDKGTYDAHDQEGGCNISEAPALDFYTPDDHHDTGYQNSQNAFFTDTEGMLMYIIF